MRSGLPPGGAARRYLWSVGYWPKETIDHGDDFLAVLLKFMSNSGYIGEGHRLAGLQNDQPRRRAGKID